MRLATPLATPLATLLGLVAAALSPARAQSRVIAGHVTTGEAVPLAVTPVLLRDAETGALVAQALSDMGGAFRVTAPAGRYRLVARRVGFRPDSMRVDVTGGDAAEVRMQLVPIAVQLAEVSVTADLRCSANLDAPPGSEALLWDEVAKGIEARRLVSRTFRYVIDQHNELVQSRLIGSDGSRVWDTVVVNDPSLPSRDSSQGDGYAAQRGSRLTVRIFGDGDLASPRFLKRHCRGTPYRDPSDGTVRIAFQPREAAPDDDADDVLVRGVVVLDPESWRTRRVEYRYVQDGTEIGGGSVSFEDRVIEGSPVALMARATGSFRVPGVMARLNGRQARWTFTFRPPRDVVRVP